MVKLRNNCIFAAIGILVALVATAAYILFSRQRLFLLLAIAASLAALYSIGEIWKNCRLSYEKIESAAQNNHKTVPDDCLFADSINQFLKGYQNSISVVNLEKAYRDTQLQVLMGQINPHFLYNTLESIRGQALLANDDIVADMAEMLSGFFRYCISKKGTIVSLKDEIQNVKTYLKIMEFRFPNKFTFNIIGDLPRMYNYAIPKLTLQPIVENAILHGIMDYTTGGVISLRLFETDTSLKIYVRDNGVGMSDEQVREINRRLLEDKDNGLTSPTGTSGIALYNINSRISLAYGHEYGIRVFSTNHVGSNIMVHLPKQLFENEK